VGFVSFVLFVFFVGLSFFRCLFRDFPGQVGRRRATNVGRIAEYFADLALAVADSGYARQVRDGDSTDEQRGFLHVRCATGIFVLCFSWLCFVKFCGCLWCLLTLFLWVFVVLLIVCGFLSSWAFYCFFGAVLPWLLTAASPVRCATGTVQPPPTTVRRMRDGCATGICLCFCVSSDVFVRFFDMFSWFCVFRVLVVFQRFRGLLVFSVFFRDLFVIFSLADSGYTRQMRDGDCTAAHEAPSYIQSLSTGVLPRPSFFCSFCCVFMCVCVCVCFCVVSLFFCACVCVCFSVLLCLLSCLLFRLIWFYLICFALIRFVCLIDSLLKFVWTNVNN